VEHGARTSLAGFQRTYPLAEAIATPAGTAERLQVTSPELFQRWS
jgi:hypothetical protein